MTNQFLSALVCVSALVAPVALSAPASANNGPDRESVELVAPEYPRGAERRGIEGSVRIAYSIDADGNVVNAQVVEASPEGVFDRAATFGASPPPPRARRGSPPSSPLMSERRRDSSYTDCRSDSRSDSLTSSQWPEGRRYEWRTSGGPSIASGGPT